MNGHRPKAQMGEPWKCNKCNESAKRIPAPRFCPCGGMFDGQREEMKKFIGKTPSDDDDLDEATQDALMNTAKTQDHCR